MFIPHRAAALVGAVVTLILVLAACGGSAGAASNAPGSSDADPTGASTGEVHDPSQAATGSDSESTTSGGGLCHLVPVEEVERALGMSTDGGVGDHSSITGGETCRFTGDADHVVDVETSDQSRDEWFAAIETVGMTDETVAGVGEEAYRAAETALGGPGARFTAWAGGRVVGVTIYGDESQDFAFAAAQAIAVAVLSAGE